MDTSINQDLTRALNRPIKIGNRTVSKRLFLAPMTQLGNVAFRQLLSTYGGYGLLFSEMSSARAIPHENRRVSAYFKWRDEEQDTLVWQLLGADPLEMAKAACRIEQEGFFGVDINLGCSVATICKRNCGAALLKNPDQAIRIVKAVRQAVTIPLFVKFRTGWDDTVGPAVDLALKLEDAGVDAVTFHPRVATDIRTRPPKWEYIARIKEALSIPVIGNGNVFGPEDCLKMLKTTGCDGVAVGRMAVVRPWLFAQWSMGFEPTSAIYRSAALQMASLLMEHFDPVTALRRFKKFSQYYAANFKFGHTLYSRILKASEIEAVFDIINHFFESALDLTHRPNLNLMV